MKLRAHKVLTDPLSAENSAKSLIPQDQGPGGCSIWILASGFLGVPPNLIFTRLSRFGFMLSAADSNELSLQIEVFDPVHASQTPLLFRRFANCRSAPSRKCFSR